MASYYTRAKACGEVEQEDVEQGGPSAPRGIAQFLCTL